VVLIIWLEAVALVDMPLLVLCLALAVMAVAVLVVEQARLELLEHQIRVVAVARVGKVLLVAALVVLAL
jgi:hypothetical protein